MLCELCQSFEVAWVHELDPARSSFRQYGKGHVWASQIYVCDRCDQLFRDGDVEALVLLQVGQAHLAPDVVDETIRKPFLVYCAAHQATIAYDDVLPPGARALRDEGFVPVEELTGDESVADAWPAAHRRSVPETRPNRLAFEPDGDRCWLIRSPWSSIPITDVFVVIWDYVHPRAPLVDRRVDPEQHRTAIAEFAALDERHVASLIAAHRAKPRDD